MNPKLLAAECIAVGTLWLIVVDPRAALFSVAAFMLLWLFKRKEGKS